MGSCTSKSKRAKSEINSILDRTWMKESKNIDKFVFENNIDQERNIKLQLIFNENCSQIPFPQDFEPEEQDALNLFFIQENKERILKGIPNIKISLFLYSIFKMKLVDYQLHELTLFSLHENEELEKVDKSYFGRNKVTSNMLNMKGVNSMNKILHLIRNDYPNLQYCPVLPRVVQFLLWFVPEKVALKMACLMLDENLKLERWGKSADVESRTIKYFSTNLKFNRYLKSFALGKVKFVADKRKAKKILEELIDNMCITVLPAEYLTLVFVGYLVSGIAFIANLAGNLLSLVSDRSKLSIADIKYYLKELNLYDTITKSHKVQEETLKTIRISQGSFNQLCSYVPVLDKPSNIFKTNEKRNELFSLIPKVHYYRLMKKVFSFDQNGLLIKELNYFWTKKSSASLLLIDLHQKIIGLFLDRKIEEIEKGVLVSNSFLFEIDKQTSVYPHNNNQELCLKFESGVGLKIGDLESPSLLIDYSLLDLCIFKQNTFGKPDELVEDTYSVSNIELFLIR